MKRDILQNGKKEYKLHPKLILKYLQKLILKIENQRLIKYLNGLSLQFMVSLSQNIIGLISKIRSFIEMKDKISGKEWEKSTPVLSDKNKESRLLIFLKITMKLLCAKNWEKFKNKFRTSKKSHKFTLLPIKLPKTQGIYKN